VLKSNGSGLNGQFLSGARRLFAPNTVSDPVVNQSVNICNNSICNVILFAYVKFFVVVSVIQRTAAGYICHVTYCTLDEW
jgi:hypothetical protein